VESLQDYQTTIYVYAGLQVIYEKNLTTNQDAVHVYGPSGRIAKRVNELTNYYHTDHLGSTRLVTNESGNIVTDATYKPFGEETVSGEENSYLYTGKERDSTGLYYYGARYYDPKIGRFTTKDPLQGEIELPQTQNRYAYCLNNPLKYIDPQGMDCEYIILPDGTISRELAEIYNKLNDALGKLSEEDWEFINEKLSSDDFAEKMEAVKEILDAAGIEYTDYEDLLVLEINEKIVTITWEDIGGLYGETTPVSNPVTKDIVSMAIKLNPNKIKQGGDLFITLGHELIHAYHIAFHWDIIRSMPTGTTAYIYGEYTAYSWSISVVHSVPYITPEHKQDIIKVYWRFRLRWIIKGEMLC